MLDGSLSPATFSMFNVDRITVVVQCLFNGQVVSFIFFQTSESIVGLDRNNSYLQMPLFLASKRGLNISADPFFMTLIKMCWFCGLSCSD